jgi:hypothetical protein
VTSIDAAARLSCATTSEGWLSVIIGLAIFALGLASLWGADLLGWTVATSVCTDPAKALSSVSKTYARLGGLSALLTTFAALLVALGAASAALGQDSPALCARLHRRVLDRLRRLDPWRRRLSRRRDARGPAEICRRLVALAQQ